MSGDDENTVVQPEPEFDPLRDLSNRLSKVELSVIRQGDRIQEMSSQLLDSLLRNSRVTHDVATSALEKLDISIDEMDNKRDELVRKIAACTDDRELFLLNMTLDNLQYRIERARAERDQALIRKEGSEQMVNDTNQKINNMRPGKDQTLSFPPIQPSPPPMSNADKIWKWLQDNVVLIIVLGVLYFIWDAIKFYVIAKVNGTIP